MGKSHSDRVPRAQGPMQYGSVGLGRVIQGRRRRETPIRGGCVRSSSTWLLACLLACLPREDQEEDDEEWGFDCGGATAADHRRCRGLTGCFAILVRFGGFFVLFAVRKSRRWGSSAMLWRFGLWGSFWWLSSQFSWLQLRSSLRRSSGPTLGIAFCGFDCLSWFLFPFRCTHLRFGIMGDHKATRFWI